MQRFITIPLCCYCTLLTSCCINNANASEHNSSTTSSSLRRRVLQVLHLPPAPVTPFRGGLSAVRSDDNNNNNDQNDSANSDGSSSVEASSSYSNNNHHRQQQPTSLQRSHNNIRTYPTSWTPEDFPNPWSNPLLCGGAATASQYHSLSPQQPQHPQQSPSTTATTSRMKRPLFCDPDQVLDQPTLGTVMMKLREFSLEFASRDFVEGGDFGLWEEVDDVGEEREQQQQQQQQQDEQQQERGNDSDNMSSNEDVQTSDDNDNSLWEVDDNEEYQEEEELQKLQPEAEQQQQSDENEGLHTSNDNGGSSDEMMTQQQQQQRRRLRHHHQSPNQGNNPSITKHNNNNNNNNNNRRQLLSSHTSLSDKDTVEVAIALVQKINLPAILRADSYFFYSDQDDMVNDAAQYFARYVHDTWNKRLMQEQQTIEGDGNNGDGDATTTATNIVLIFISVHDRICYISSGTRIASILPWWRLEHVVQDMKPMLRKGRTGEALQVAIEDMTSLLRAGSPTVKDRMDDFFSRFGVVLAFAFFTFLFATYGEYQDRRKRVILAERRSRMNEGEREKARALQKEFQTKVCPICLETFLGCGSSSSESGKEDIATDTDGSIATRKCDRKKEEKNKRVDSHGIPIKGNDNKPIKLLRCGHIFDETCWKMWVDSGHGNAMMCPVCRQDIGRGKRGGGNSRQQQQDTGGGGDAATSTNNDNGNSSGQQQQQQHSLFFRIMEHAHAATAPATLLRPINNLHTNNYGSTLLRSNRLDYEEGLNDSSVTSFYSTETTPLM